VKVVEVVYNWPAETFIQRHIQALQAAQVSLRIVARHAPRSLNESASLGEANGNITAEIMPNFNHMNGAGKLAGVRFLTGKSIRSQDATSVSKKVLLGYFERLHPDLIHFHDASLAASMCWIPLALGIPYTLSLRGSDIQILAQQSFVQRDATLSALDRAARVHAVCQALGKTTAQIMGQDLDFSVIHTTLPVSPALPTWRGRMLDDPIHFLTSGRLVWMKGFDNLLIALRSLRDLGLDARLTIIGDGPELSHLLYLRKMLDLESVVTFPGKMSFEQILCLFEQTHAFIQSSVAEGLSNSLAEAMAHGLPVFATNIGGTCEVIEDGVTGFLLPPFAPQDWVEILTQVRDTGLMQQIRAAAYDKARQVFTAERHAQAFLDFYENAINSKQWRRQ
jgi:glycosyltransferase involved in cell wall biosynthesis